MKLSSELISRPKYLKLRIFVVFSFVIKHAKFVTRILFIASMDPVLNYIAFTVFVQGVCTLISVSYLAVGSCLARLLAYQG